LADIIVACSLHSLFTVVLDPAARTKFPHVTRYFLTLLNQGPFKQVIGAVKLAEQEQIAQPAGKGKKEKAGEEDEEKETVKPTKSPKGGKPKEKEAVESETAGGKKEKKKKDNKDDEEEDDMAQYQDKEEKPKEETEEMKWAKKPSKCDLDGVKKLFSNNPPKEAMAEFWNIYDPEVYTLWESVYQNKAELKLDWQASNLVEGFIQRLEKLRKVSFGVINVVGEQGPFGIEAGWLFKWTDIPSSMTSVDDFPFHAFKKLDASTAEGKARLEELWIGGLIGSTKLFDRWQYK